MIRKQPALQDAQRIAKLLVHLQKLIAVSNHGSQTNAAIALGISKSTLSAGLQALNDGLRVRVWNNSSLTPEGSSLARRCGQLLEELNLILSNPAALLRVGVTHYVARNFLMDCMPDGKMSIYQGDVHSLFTKLRDGKMDIVLGADPSGVNQDIFVASGKCPIPYCIVANRNYSPLLPEDNKLPGSELLARLLKSSNKWALSSPGTLTRLRLDNLLRQTNKPLSWWLPYMVAESSDETILMDVVNRIPGAVAILPWGPGMDRQLSTAKSVIKFPLQSDSTWWPDVEVGAFECKGPSSIGIQIGQKLSNVIRAYRTPK
ncbi:MAG: LysR family transcriptional regulator [Azonexus sp.]